MNHYIETENLLSRFRTLKRWPVMVMVGLLITLSTYTSSSAQTAGLTTEDLQGPMTADSLANELVGVGVQISNVEYIGAEIAAGTFTGDASIVGFDSGIILSTGKVSDVEGANQKENTSEDNSSSGDSQLDQLAGATTEDAAVLSFDFVPDGDEVFFNFVFSSEEYNEYVNSKFNDVFAFYVNGTNCALVDGAPVSINTINNGNPKPADSSITDQSATNPQLFRNNRLPDGSSPINIEMDGLTTVLTCSAPVNNGQTNTLKLAIADTADGAYDSNVFIEAGSLTTIEPPEVPTPVPAPPTEPKAEKCTLLPFKMTSWGDVHITSPDGLTYDFQEVGDYLLSEAAPIGTTETTLVLQARQTSHANIPNASVNTAVAMNVGGDILEFYVKPEQTLFVNGEKIGLPRAEFQLKNGGSISINETGNERQKEFSIIWPGGHTEVRVRLYLTPHIDIGIARLDCTQSYVGLLGNFDLNLENDMQIKGGEIIVPPASPDQLKQFGISWKVDVRSSLFTGFEPPAEPTTSGDTLTIWDINYVERLKATTVCKDAGITDPIALGNCIYDVALTGDASFVGSAKSFEVTIPSLDVLINLGLNVDEFTGIGIDVERLKLDYGIDIETLGEVGADLDVDISGIIPPLDRKVIAVSVTETVNTLRGELTVEGEIAVRDLSGTYRYFQLNGDPDLATGKVAVNLCPGLDIQASVDVYDIITVDEAKEEGLTALNVPCSGGATAIVERVPFLAFLFTNPLWLLVIGLVLGMIVCRVITFFRGSRS